MANTIAEYLEELKRLLNGRLPAQELSSLLAESEAHLVDLKTDLEWNSDAEQLALEKFGPAKSFARKTLKDRRQTNIWKAALWPIAIILIQQFVAYFLEPHAGMSFVISNGQPMHPFSIMLSPLQLLNVVALILFVFACFKARRLFPLQIGMVSLVIGLISVLTYTTHTSIPTRGRDGIAYNEIPRDLQRLADAQRAFTQGSLVFSGERKALPTNSEFLVAGRYALPLWFLEKGVKGNRLFINNHETGWGVQVYEPNNSLPDPAMFTTTDWNYATAVWTPQFLKGYRSQLNRNIEEDKIAISVPPVTALAPLSREKQVIWILDTALHGFVIFFALNLIGWAFGWICDSALLFRRRYRRLA